MRDVRIALAQFAPILGDIDRNLASHLEFVERAIAEDASVVVFPELSLTGYHLLDQVPEVALASADPRWAPLLEASKRIDLVVGFVEDGPGHRFYNAAAYLSGGICRHIHRKIYLPTYGMFQEGRDFAAGDTLRGYERPYAPAGTLICEDLWHPSSVWLLAQQGVEVIFVLSNGPTRGARTDGGITSVRVWEDLLRVQAQFHTAFFVYVNRTGCEDGLIFGGGSLVVDPFGRIVEQLPALDDAFGVVTLDAEVLRRARVAYPLLRDENVELVFRELGRLRTLRFDLPEADRSGEP